MAKAVAHRLELSAMETGCKNDDLVSVVNTGGGHWVALRVEKATSQITIYDPLQTGRQYPRLDSLWRSVAKYLHHTDFRAPYVEGGPRQSDGHNCALLALQAIQCWMRHAPRL